MINHFYVTFERSRIPAMNLSEKFSVYIGEIVVKQKSRGGSLYSLNGTR